MQPADNDNNAHDIDVIASRRIYCTEYECSITVYHP